jgi:hypothetical protein
LERGEFACRHHGGGAGDFVPPGLDALLAGLGLVNSMMGRMDGLAAAVASKNAEGGKTLGNLGELLTTRAKKVVSPVGAGFRVTH